MRVGVSFPQCDPRKSTLQDVLHHVNFHLQLLHFLGFCQVFERIFHTCIKCQTVVCKTGHCKSYFGNICFAFFEKSYLAVCSYHVPYVFQSESTLCSCLNVKELLAQNRHKFWNLSDCNGTWTHNHLICKLILIWVFVYELSGCGFESRCSHFLSAFCEMLETDLLLST